MILRRVLQYLDAARISVQRHKHGRAVTAQELAESLGIGGYQVAKAVLIQADGRTWMAVLPGPEILDLDLLKQRLNAQFVRLLDEPEFAELLPDCDPGAAPPFGSLYGVPVIVDTDLAEEPEIVFRAGSHDESIGMRYQDFARLERPVVADFARPFIYPHHQPAAQHH